LDFIDLIIHAYVALMLFIVYLVLHRASRAQSQPKREESQDVKEFVTSSPQLKQVLNDVERANDISDNSLQVVVNVKNQQQDLKVGVDKALVNIGGLEESLKSIEKSIQRFDRILLDPQAKGALGEQFVANQLSILPQDWVRQNVPFRNDTRVEFCVRSVDGRLIPIDSKWPATRLIDQLGQTTDKLERKKLESAIKNEVWRRAQDLHKYLDDDRTIGFGIAAVPDSVFALCSEVQPYLVKMNIVLISYSLLVPYILLLVKLFLSNAQGIQAMQISQIISSSIIEIEQIQEFIDTDLRKPLDTVKLQQTEFRSQNERLQAVNNKLIQIQNELNTVKDSLPTGISSLSDSEISSLPDDLKHRVGELRKTLIESKAKQNGQVPNEVNQKPVE
jgi:hypothetical protein